MCCFWPQPIRNCWIWPASRFGLGHTAPDSNILEGCLFTEVRHRLRLLQRWALLKIGVTGVFEWVNQGQTTSPLAEAICAPRPYETHCHGWCNLA